MRSASRPRRKGFTLTELVVTIVLLGLLASIAGVAYSNFLADMRREALRADALVFDQAYRALLALDTIGSGVDPVSGEAARVAAVVAAFSGDSAPSYAAGLAGAAGQVEFEKSGLEVCLALPASLAAAVSVANGECVVPTAPGAPTGLTVTPGDTTAALSWTAPADNGGAAITDYTVEFSDDEGLSWNTFTDGVSTESSATVTGLTNGTVYSFRVTAVNAVGSGTASTSLSGTPVTTPGAPTALAATPDNGSVALSWQAPASTGGAALTDYVVEFSTNGGSSWSVFADGVSTSTSAVVTSLSNGTTFTFRVSAVNTVGTGTPSGTATTTPATTPGTPTVSSTSSDTTSLTVNFSAPASNGGSAITGYTVTCTSPNGGTTRTGTAASSPITVASLTEGKNYSCTMVATNAVGDSSAVNVTTMTAAWVDTSYYTCPSGGSLSGSTCTQTVANYNWTCPPHLENWYDGWCYAFDYWGYYYFAAQPAQWQVVSYSYPTYSATLVSQGYWNGWTRA